MGWSQPLPWNRSQNCVAGDEFCYEMGWSQPLPWNRSQNCVAGDEFCYEMGWSQNLQGAKGFRAGFVPGHSM